MSKIDLELLEAHLLAYGNTAKNKRGEIVFIYGLDEEEIFNLCLYLARQFPESPSSYIEFVKNNIYPDQFGHMVIKLEERK